MLHRRTLLGALPALGAPAILARPVRAQGDRRPELRVAVQALPPTPEPMDGISNVGLRLVGNLFDTPLRRDFLAEAANPGASVLRPSLATAVRRIDPLTWELALRPGVVMHDGAEMTSEDVLATLSEERMRGPRAPWGEGRILWGHVAEVQALDRHTVRLVTRTPDVAMEQRLGAYGFWVISAKAWAEGGLAGSRRAPVGTGPYRLASFERDNRVVLDAHDAHFDGPPPARRVTIQVVPEPATRLAGLVSGEFDLVTNLLTDQAGQLARYPDVEAVSVSLDLVHILYYDTRRPALRDKRVRQALNHAIDYDLLARTVWGEGASRPNGFQTPAFGPLYDGARKFQPYDPDRARRLLREAGYGGQEIVLRLMTGYYANSSEAAQIIQAMWAEVGVPMKLEFVESVQQNGAPGADVRMVSVAFRFPDPAGGGVIVHLGRESGLQRNGFWTPTEYNEVGDALSAATETSERRRLFQKMQDILEDEAPLSLLYAVQETFGKRKSLRYTQYPLYYMDLRSPNLAFG